MFLSPINGLHGSAYARCYKYFVPNRTLSAPRCSLFASGLATLDLSDLKINERC